MITYDGKHDLMEKTVGALVVDPKSGIYGLFEEDHAKRMIVSADFSSLYPTIMALLNITFETLRHKVYDANVVGSLFNMLFSYKSGNNQKYVNVFADQLESMLLQYAKNNKGTVKQKEKWLKYNISKNQERLNRLLIYLNNNPIESLLTPTNNFSYYIFIECLYPLLEVFSKIHPNVPSNICSETLVDCVLREEEFEKEYKAEKFYILQNPHSTKRSFNITDYDTFMKDYRYNYIITPSGALFDKHDDKLGNNTKNIADMQIQRKVIQTQGESLEIINKEAKSNEILYNHIETKNFAEIVKSVTLSDNMIRAFDNFNPLLYDLSNYDAVNLLANSLGTSEKNLKIRLNSLYGIAGLKSYFRASPLVSNAITIGARIYGIVYAAELLKGEL